MLQNYSKFKKILLLILITVWVFISFLFAQIALAWLIQILQYFHFPFESINKVLFNTIGAVLIYIIAIVFALGIPWLVKKRKTTLMEIGLNRLPSWMNILIVPLGFIVYIILSALLISVATRLFPWFDVNQAQDTGFDHLNKQFEYILAFVTLIVISPIAEEILFRGYLFGKLKKIVPVWLAVGVTSLLFGFVHGAWNLAIDTFALSIVLCYLREITGNLWSSILLHMIKNGVAFYILFINPSILATLIR